MIVRFSDLCSCLWKLSVPRVRLKQSVKSWVWKMSLGCPRANWDLQYLVGYASGGHKVAPPSLQVRKWTVQWSNAMMKLSQVLRRDSASTHIQGKMQFSEHRAWNWPWFLAPFAKQAGSSCESGIVNSRSITGFILCQFNNLLITIGWPVMN